MAYHNSGNDILKMRRDNRKKKKEQTKASTQKNNSTDILKTRRNNRLRTSIGFDTLSSDIDALNKSLNNVYNGWQTPETMANTLSSVQSMYDRLGKYQLYQKENGGTDLSELMNSYKSTIDSWDSMVEEYRDYKTKEDYDKAMKERAEKQKQLETYDFDAGNKKISDLEKYLKSAGKYQSKITGLQNRQNTWNHRAGGMSDGGVGNQLKTAQSEYDKFLKSIDYASYEDLEKALGDEKVLKNNATRYQETLKLGSVGDVNSPYYDKDYNKYVEIGKDIPSDEVGTATKKRSLGAGKARSVATIKKSDTRLAAEALQAYLKGEKLGDDKNAYDKAAIFDLLTEKEYNDIAYYIGKDSEDGGNRLENYLETIEETLNSRRGKEISDILEGDTLGQYLFGVDAGLDQFVTGVKNNFSDKDYIPTNQVQYASGEIREDLYHDSDWGWGARAGYDLLNTTSNMLPSILLSAATGPAGAVVGAGAMGLSASGNAYQEMLNLGYDKGQARTYSVLVGASEAGLQYALGGIGKLGGTSAKIAKAVSGIDNGLARFALRWGGSMLSEGFEEAAQEVLTPIFKQVAAGYDTGDKIDWGEVAYSGLLGALSGGIMEGPGIATNMIAEHSYNKSIGQNIRDNAKVGDVFDFALNSPETSLAYEAYSRYANKGISAENATDAQVGSLWQNARTDKENIAHGKKSTSNEVLFAKDDYAKLGDMAKYNTEARVTDAINKEYNKRAEKSKKNETTDSLIEKGLSFAEGTEAHKIAADYKAKLDKGETLTSEEVSKLAEVTTKATRDANLKDVTERLKKLGERKNITKVAEVITKRTMGEDITAEEIKLLNDSDYGVRVFYESTEGAVAYTNGMSNAEANLFWKNYDGKVDMEAYATSFNLMKEYARHPEGFTQDEVLNNKGVLSAKAATNIYNGLFHIADLELAEANNKALERLAKMNKGKVGNIDDTIMNYGDKYIAGKVNWKSLNRRQQQAFVYTKGLFQSLGSNVVFVGKEKEFNGAYDVKGDTIYIDVYAGMDTKTWTGNDVIINTVAHEMTHQMKVRTPDMHKHLTKLVLDGLEKTTGKTRNELIANEVIGLLAKEYKAKYERENPGKKISIDEAKEKLSADAIDEALKDPDRNDDAIDEIVARSCEGLLSMSKEARSMFESLAPEEQNKLVALIKDIIKKITDWIDEFLKSYGAHTNEANNLKKDKERYEAMSLMWDNMLREVQRQNKAIMESAAEESVDEAEAINSDLEGVGLEYDADSESIAPATMKLSERTWNESEYVQNREVAIKAIVKALGVSESDAARYVDNINSIAKMIADDRTRLDYEPNIDEFATVIKPNSEYKWTVDISTLCAKRLLFTGTFDAIQKRLPNTVFDSDDIVSLRSMMMKKGYEVACGICYVESTRRELGPITQEFIERYKEAQKTGKPITRINSEGKAVELKKTKEQMETTMDKSAENFFADKDYTPTLAELNTTDIDIVKRDHPLVYEAYLNFMNARGQAKPKLLETRTEYKGEILKHFKAKTAVDARNNAGGLRVQSFSDFEIAHLIDMMQIVLDMSRVGLKSQAYTKVPAFADVFGNTGMKINLSLIAKDSGLDADGNLIFDDVEGMPAKEAFRLREKYSKNVGTILVGKNDAHIRAALADPRIDFVIPFHKSSWKESLYEALGLEGYDDYTDYQNEKPFDKDRKIKNFQPSEYWDYTKSGNENAQTYLKMCAEDGRTPKFPQFAHLDGYWKLLIDFKMYNNDGIGSPQEVVKPDFAMNEAYDVLDSYEGGHRSFPVADDIVDEFVDGYEKNNLKRSDRVDETNSSAKKTITLNMSEDERYEILKDKTITLANVDTELYQKYVKEIPELLDKKLNKKDAKKLLKKLGEDFGVFKEYDNKEFDITFEFGSNNLRESVQHQRENYELFAQMLSCFSDVISNAVGIEVHNRNDIGYKPDETLKNMYVLFSAFENGTDVVPVKLSVKEFTDKGNRLYLAIALESIKIDRVVSMGVRDNPTHIRTSPVTISIAKLFENVNIKDADFLKYLPNQFLNEEQIEAKEKALGINKTIKFADRTDTTVYDLMGERDALIERNKRLEESVKRLEKRLSLDKTVTGGTVFREDRVKAVARHLVKTFDSKADVNELTKKLMDNYSYIAQLHKDNPSGMPWQDVFAGCYNIAYDIANELKPRIEIDDYSASILKEIRKTRISLNEAQKTEAQNRFGKNWNRGFMGRVIIANDGLSLDKQWQEWAGKYPSTFSKDTNPMDMLQELSSIVDSLQEARETIVEYNTNELTMEIAEEIYNKFWTITPIQTTADKYVKEIKKLNYEHRMEMEKAKAEYEQNRITDKNKSLRLAKELRERRVRDVAKAKELGKKRLDSFKENAERKTKIQSITATTLSLADMYTKNSKDKHIPEIMKGPVRDIINAINFSSKRLIDKGIPTKKDISLQNALKDIQTMLTDSSGALDGGIELYGTGLTEDIKKMLKDVDALAKEYGDNELILQTMSLDSLKTLDATMKVVRASVNKLNKYHVVQHNAGVEALGVETAKDVDDAKKIYKDHKKHFDKLKTKLYWNQLNPYYAFKNLGKSAQKVFKAFMDGQDKIAFLAKEVIDKTKEIYSEKEYKGWSKQFFDFEIKQPDGSVRKFRMNVPQIMSLYCVAKQDDAKKHLLHGKFGKDGEIGNGRGITLVETEKTAAVVKNILLTEADLNNIIATLDRAEVGRAKEVADKLQNFMATRGAELGNEISMARWGIKSFGIENYFPIKVSDGQAPEKGDTPGVQGNPLVALLNMSFTHARNHYAPQSIEIGDAFDVFSNHMSSMIQYNAMALPVLDMYKWMNTRVTDENGNEISVKTSIKDTFGEYAWSYFNTFLQDVNGSTKGDTRDNIAVKFFKNAKIAKVAANIRVALLQFTSYIRAGAVMDNKYLLRAFLHKPKIKMSTEKCGMVLWKSFGYYETDITRPLTDKIKHTEGVKNKIVEWSMKGAEVMDKVTLGYLWNACELEVRDTRKDLAVGSKEFYKEIGLRLREVIYQTQVVDSQLTRSQMMRSKGGWDKVLTTFASESTLSFNLITDLFVSYKLDSRRIGKEAAKQKHGKYMRKAITAYVVTNVVTSMLATMFDAFRDWDEEDKDEEYIFKLMLENMATNSSFINKIPYINQFVSTISGFTPSRVETDWMKYSAEAVKEIYKLMTGEGSGEKVFEKTLRALSDATGIAGYNLYRDVRAFIELFN